MTEDVILHGELAELRSQSRCEPCQKRNSPCIIQAEGDKCIACLGAVCECIFERTFTLRASKSRFSWEQLLKKENGLDPPTGDELASRKYVYCQHRSQVFKAGS